jgi:hypothetical protein
MGRNVGRSLKGGRNDATNAIEPVEAAICRLNENDVAQSSKGYRASSAFATDS